jgi:hypothetical protein
LIQIHAVVTRSTEHHDSANLALLSRKFFAALPFRSSHEPISTISGLAEFQQMCHTLRDLLPSSEAAATAAASSNPLGAMLAALHCDITVLAPESAAFDGLQRAITENNESVNPQRRMVIRHVYASSSLLGVYSVVCWVHEGIHETSSTL